MPKLTELVSRGLGFNRREQQPASSLLSTLWPQPVPGGQLSSDEPGDGLRQFLLGCPTLGFSKVLSFLGLPPFACAVPSAWNIPSPTSKLNLTPIHASSLNREVIFPRNAWGSPDLMCMLSTFTSLLHCHNGFTRLYTILEVRYVSLRTGHTYRSRLLNGEIEMRYLVSSEHIKSPTQRGFRAPWMFPEVALFMA